MSHPRIFIHISRTEISLSYSEGNSEDLPRLFPSGNWPMKLNDFAGPNACPPTFKIGKEINERFAALFPDRPGLKSETEVLLIPENSVDDKEMVKIVNDLLKWGFSNVRHIHPDVPIINVALHDAPYHGAVVAASDGTDLYLSLFNAQNDDFARVSLPGLGKDNRVELAAELIWEQVKDRTSGLRKEREMEALKTAAERFLSTNKAEISGSVALSDGYSYDYFLSRKKLRDSDVNNEESVDDKFTEILLQHGMADRSAQIIILRGEAIGSRFLKENLTEAFCKVEEETGSFAEAVSRNLATEKWDHIADRPKVVTLPKEDPEPIDDEDAVEEEELETEEPPTFTTARISAEIVKEKTGFFSKKSILKVKIDVPDGKPLKWNSVVCIQEKPLKNVESENIVAELDKGDIPPFEFSFDLPLRHLPKARRLRIYLKASPDEKIGINNAYDCDPLMIDL